MKTKLLSMLLMVGIAVSSCSKKGNSHPEAPIPVGEKSISLSISLGELNMTKSTDVALVSGNPVQISDNKITIQTYTSVDGTGDALSTQTVEITNSEFFAAGADNVYTSVASAITVPENAVSMRVTANADGQVVSTLTLSDNINTRQGLAGVKATGAAAITKPGGEEAWAAAVIIKPDMARVEVKGILEHNGASSTAAHTYVSDVQIQAIYANNTIMTRSETANAGFSRTASTSWADDFNKENPGAAKGYLYDDFSEWTGDGGLTSGIQYGNGFDNSNPTNALWASGFNIFQQSGLVTGGQPDASKFHPHMILKLQLKKRAADGESGEVNWGQAEVCYLNVIAFKADNNYVVSFTPGNVYQFDLKDVYTILNDVVPPVTTQPDPEKAGIDITVTVGTWSVITVTPEV